MSQSILVLQGKSFIVELQSMYGSSNYGWCLSSMPKGIVLLGIENVSMENKTIIGPVKQTFYFAAVSAEEKVTLKFDLISAACPTDVKAAYSAEVQIIPANSEDFVQYSDNANVKYGYCCGVNEETKAAIPYGVVYSQNPAANNNCPSIPGFPVYPLVAYGFGCNENTNLKYGYPCGVNDAVLKYGYPGCTE